MKKEIVILFLFILVSIPLISAVEFDMKDSYKKGETLLAKVSGNFVEPLLKSNIYFYRERTDGKGYIRTTANVYDITKINDEYYIYAQLPEEANNYSLNLEDVRYYKGSQISEDDLIKYFIITNETFDFSIYPGFINTAKDFSVKLQNLQDSKITVSITTTTETGRASDSIFAQIFGGEIEEAAENSLTLKSGEIKDIDFSSTNVKNSTFKKIKFSTANSQYELPVFIFSNQSRIEEESELQFNLRTINVTSATNSETQKIIYLENTGDKDLENINLSLSSSLKDYVSLSITNISKLEKNTSQKIELVFYANKTLSTLGTLKARSNLTSDSADVYFTTIKDYIPPANETPGDNPPPTNSNGTLIPDEPTGSSSGAWIGWILVIAIVGFLVWFFFTKYRRAKRPFDLIKRAEKGSKMNKGRFEDED